MGNGAVVIVTPGKSIVIALFLFSRVRGFA